MPATLHRILLSFVIRTYFVLSITEEVFTNEKPKRDQDLLRSQNTEEVFANEKPKHHCSYDHK